MNLKVSPLFLAIFSAPNTISLIVDFPTLGSPLPKEVLLELIFWDYPVSLVLEKTLDVFRAMFSNVLFGAFFTLI